MTLSDLDLSVLYLSGTIPSTFSQLSKLTSLFLNSSQLIANFSEPTVFDNMTSLQSLQLNNNDFYGSFPSFIGKLPNLASVDIGTNWFSGNLSAFSGNYTSLTYLTFSHHFIERASVVFYKQPVMDLVTLAIDRKRLAFQCVENYQRDQLLGEVERTVVI